MPKIALINADTETARWIMTHEQVVEELRHLRAVLRLHRTTAEIAEIADVSAQTLKQYCMLPGKRGSRLIPGDRLDALRNAHALQAFQRLSRSSVPWQPREERQWLVCRQDGEPVLDITNAFYAECYAARHGLIAVRGLKNIMASKISEEEQLCIDWLEVRHSGLVTKDDAMAVTGTDEWTEGLVGYELKYKRIVPTQGQIDALRAIADQRREAARAA